MVLRYAHLAPDHLAEHAKQIDAVFNAASQIRPIQSV